MSVNPRVAAMIRRSAEEEDAAVAWARTFEGALPTNEQTLRVFLETAFMAGAYWRRQKGVASGEWQPAETAPQDGQHILVKCEDNSDGFGTFNGRRVHWHAVVHYFAHDRGFFLSSGCGDGEAVRFTHWMPL